MKSRKVSWEQAVQDSENLSQFNCLWELSEDFLATQWHNQGGVVGKTDLAFGGSLKNGQGRGHTDLN